MLLSSLSIRNDSTGAGEAHGGARGPLRLLLDARKLGHGGIGVYIENLAAGFAKRDDVECTLLVHGDAYRDYDWSAHVRVIEERAKLYSLDELIGLPRRVDFSKFDLFHAPHYTLPYRIPIPSIVTVHDLIHVHHPERFFYPLVAQTLIRSAVRRAAEVVVVSEATARDVRELFPEQPHLHRKIHVVPNAVEPGFVRLREREKGRTQRRAKGKACYLMAVVSTDKPHKGLNDLLEAFAILKERKRAAARGVQLVVAGFGARAPDISHLDERRRHMIAEHVQFLGKLSKGELSTMYLDAAAVVVPSRAEGFCLPALEAHAHGVPVITRPVPAIRELVTSFDVVARDFSLEALADAMESFLVRNAGEGERCDLSFLEPYMDRFSRAAVCEGTLAVYRDALTLERGSAGLGRELPFQGTSEGTSLSA